MTAAHVEETLDRANRLTRAARDAYMHSVATESDQTLFALLEAVEGLHNALIAVCNFYNSHNLVMDEAVASLQAQQAAFQEEVER